MKKVLIVDDASTIRMYHSSILQEAGMEVSQAVNGLEGLEKAMSGEFDLMLVDVNMPKMDGYSLVANLRSIENIAQPIVIMISTEAQELDESRAYEVGANLYLVKPIKPEALKESVALLMGTFI